MKIDKVLSIVLFLSLVFILFLSSTLVVSGKDNYSIKIVSPHQPTYLIIDQNNQSSASQLKVNSSKEGLLQQLQLKERATKLRGIPSGISNFQWQKCLGGANDDCIYDIQQTRDGGYVMAGETTSNDSDVLGNHGCSDVWVVRLDSNGSIQWQECFGGNSSDVAYSVEQTSDLGYVLIGTTLSSNDEVSGNHGSSDAWVVKLDSNGSMLWQKCLGGSGWDEGKSIQQTADGGYIFAGVTWSNEVNVADNHGSSDAWAVRLDSNGSLLWQKCFGGSDCDEGKSIQQTTDGGYIVAGATWSNDGNVTGNHGSSDAWVVRLDSNGSLQWQKCLGGSGSDGAKSIQQTSEGGFIVAGETESNDGDVSGNHGSSDAWVVKLSSSGVVQWQRCLGGSANEYANSVQRTTDGGYIIAEGTWSNDGDANGNHGNEDFWIVKLESNGTTLWQKCLGGSDYEEAHSVMQTKDGGYIIAGDTQSNDGDISGNHGSIDAWVVKLSGISNPPGMPAVLSGPNSAFTGIICNYSTVSTDPDGDQVKYTFDWGDGITSATSFVDSGTKANASQSWSRAGTYKVSAYSTDSKGAMSGWSKFLIVTVKNPLDTPKFSRIADFGYVGLSYGFFASTVDYRNQVMYTFDWGNNTNYTVTSLTDPTAIVKVFHTWNHAGSYQIRTKVTNIRGETSEWSDPLTVTIIANNPPNTPSAPSGPVFGSTGNTYTYTFSASDPDADQIMYTLDWGDGTTSVTGFAVSGMIMSESHSWRKAGTYQVKAKGTDSRGSFSFWSIPLSITINTPPAVPTEPSGNISGYIWAIYEFSTCATDPNFDNVKYTFDWGDGTTTTTNLVNSGTISSASHSWSKAGVYLVTTNATDSKGASSGWSKPLAVVISANSPPNMPALPLGTATCNTGVSYKYSASAADPDGDQVTYTFDWGDGTKSTTSSVNSGTSASGSHSWTKAGTFNVKAMATDRKGTTSGWSGSLSVTVMVSGNTIPGATNWQTLSNNVIYVDVNTAAAGFTATPRYLTSIGGSANQRIAQGISAIYSATPTGFRLYLMGTNGVVVTPAYANSNGWYVQWLGVPTTATNAGSTPSGATNWQTLSNNVIYVDVNTAAAGFTATPRYITSIGGSANQRIAQGISAIYSATPTGFRLCLMGTNGVVVTPAYANSNGWYVQWLGVPTTATNAGSTPSGATNWQTLSNNVVYVDVNTEAAGFTTTPRYFTSIGGISNQIDTQGINAIYSATPKGFRIYLRNWNDAALTPAYANSKGWYVQWLGCP